MTVNDRELVGVFKHLDSFLEAIRKLQKMGIQDFTVFSPVPRHEIQEIIKKKPSPVRYFTLIGALAGCFSGFGLAVFSAVKWGLIIGGRPIISIPPFIIIAFEVTVLLAALATTAGLLLTSRLPKRARPAFDPRFSQDHFGIVVRGPENQSARVREVFNSTGVTEIIVRDRYE